MKNKLSKLPLILLAAFLFLSGCSSRPKLAEVSGTVTMDGKPLAEVEVKFIPDPEQGNNGQYSVGTTDANGKFTLIYNDESLAPGVSIGKTKIVVRDLISAYSGRDDKPKTSRFHAKYSLASTTPLAYEVTEGTQEYEVKVTRQ